MVFTSRASALDLFSNHELLKMNLSGKLFENWEERNKRKIKYNKAEIHVNGNPIKVLMKARGNKRLFSYTNPKGVKVYFCDYPLLTIMSTEESSLFKAGQKHYYTSHCNDNEKKKNVSRGQLMAGNNFLIREYLSYHCKLY